MSNVASVIAPPPNWQVQEIEATPSTMPLAHAAAQAGCDAGWVIRTNNQTAGHGRRGRGWAFVLGNLACSLVLRPNAEEALSNYSFVLALAVADGLRAYLPATAAICLKWPNDVLVNGKKIAGILLEATQTSRGPALIAGIGLNIQPLADNSLPATSMAAAGAPALPSAATFLETLLEAISTRLTQCAQHGFASILADWQQEAAAGEYQQAGEVGQYLGLTASGALRLRKADGTEMLIHAGEVEMVRHATRD